MTEPSRSPELPVAQGSSCGCCATGQATAAPVEAGDGQDRPVAATYLVTGMTCGHCTGSVTARLEDLAGVRAVSVELVAGGASRVKISSRTPLADEQVQAALTEAGGYRLVGIR